ncbi:HAD family hydrolase [Pendulispora albinea]|uniref:phosphoglycolate phosphatase n=1 Tax=Pendulispora albinea TaxID=2741071 RepID=A0ABZ2M5X8_9BACT
MSSSAAGSRFAHVIFDWNGTLLDDFPLALRSVNHVLAKHSRSPIDADRYREFFGFPIRGFYERIGFNFNVSSIAFEDVMRDYLGVFDPALRDCPLHDGVLDLLDHLDACAIPASILTASHQDTLDATLHHFGLAHRFVHRIGLPDSNAHSKLELARDLQRRLEEREGITCERILYVGDTTHDGEIARAMGWGCVAIPRGHQPRSTLLADGLQLVERLHELQLLVGGTR